MIVEEHEIEAKINNEYDFGNQEVVGYLDDEVVLSFNDSLINNNKFTWRTGLSTTVPTDINKAKAYSQLIRICVGIVKRLTNYSNAKLDLLECYFYDMDNNIVYELAEIISDPMEIYYKFNVFESVDNYDTCYKIDIYTNLEGNEIFDKYIVITEEQFNELKEEEIKNKIKSLNEELNNL